MRALATLVCGTLFGVGLTVSGMVDPSKVLAFLDVTGAFDPALAGVMGGAVVTSALAFRWIRRLERPLLAPRFEWPRAAGIDGRLLAGAAIFGVGWGIGGLCPGPALASLVFGRVEGVVFVAAMLLGMRLSRVTARDATCEK